MSLGLDRFSHGEPAWDEKLNRNLQIIEDYVNELERVNSSSADVTVEGRTLVNLLGRAGDAVYGIPIEDSNQYGVESSLYKDQFVCTITKNSDLEATPNSGFMLDISAGKYYIALAYVMISGSCTSGVFGPVNNINIDSISLSYVRKKDVFLSSFSVFKCTKNTKKCITSVFNDGNIGDVCRFKYARVYEITKDEYDVILNMTSDEVAARYPYVDDCKSVVNPFIESKENLLEGAIWHKGNFNVNGDMYNGSGYGVSTLIDGLTIGETYTLSSYSEISLRLSVVGLKDGEYQEVFEVPEDTDVLTFTPTTSTRFSVCISNSGLNGNDLEDKIIESLFMKETQLVLCKGDTAKKPEECHNSRIVFDTKLYEGEKIWRTADGKYVKNSMYNQIDIKDLFVNNNIKGEGYHRIGIYINNDEKIYKHDTERWGNECFLISYDGSLIEFNPNDITKHNTFTVEKADTDLGKIYIVLSNELTGWGNDYTPTTEEIKAFFLGWHMYRTNENPQTGNVYTEYNGIGDKGWVKLWCGCGERALINKTSIKGSEVTECPSEMNDKGYIPYRFIYKKEEQTIDEIRTYGNLKISKDSVLTSTSGFVTAYIHPSYSNIYKVYANLKMNGEGRNQVQYDERCRGIISANTIDNEAVRYEISPRSASEFDLLYGDIYIEKISSNKDLIVEYLLRNTVTSFDYSIRTVNMLKDAITNINEEIANTCNELFDTKTELERTKHLLGQRSNPNLLINGDFKIWQRGESFPSTEEITYSADRWAKSKSSIEKVPNGLKSTIKASSSWWLRQILEGKYNGNMILSFKTHNVRITTTKVHVRVHTNGYMTYNEQIAIKPNKEYHINIGYIYQYDLTKPMSVGIVSDIDCNVAIDDYIVFEWVKLEYGDVATPFVPKTYQEELGECQRYFLAIKPFMDYFYGRIHSDKKTFTIHINCPVRMRTIPTIEQDLSLVLFGSGNNWNRIIEHTNFSILGISSSGLITSEIPIGQGDNVASYNAITGYFNMDHDISVDAEIYC